MSLEPIESKKEQHLRYLQEEGLLDQISQVLVDMHHEKNTPQDPLAYFKQYLGSPSDLDRTNLQKQIGVLEEENKGLVAQKEALEKEINDLKPKEEEKEEEKKEEEE